MAKKRQRRRAKKKPLTAELAAELRRKRSSLLQGVAESQEESRAIVEQRESEIEESAQVDRIARVRSRLDQRGQRMIREIDASLDRLAAGTYGKCARCGRDIGSARLRAVPTATLCIDCATAREKREKSLGGEPEFERLPGSDVGIEGGFGTEDREE